MKQPSATPISLASAIAQVMSWPDAEQGKRRSLRSALRALARLERRPAEVITLDATRHIDLLERATAAELGCSEGTLRNYRSGLRHVLRGLGLLASTRVNYEAQDPAWIELLSALPPERDFMRLRGFISWCAMESVTPALVSQATLDAYCAHRVATKGGSRQHDHATRVAGLWQRASKLVPEWPRQPLRPTRQIEPSLPIEAYSANLPAEIQAYRDWMAGGLSSSICDPDSIRPRSERTVATRVASIRRLLHGALKGGITIDRLGNLSALTNIEVIRASLTWHWQRKGRKANADTSQLLGTIVSLAMFYRVKPSLEKEFEILARHLRPPTQTERLARNAGLLDELDEPLRRAKLLHLPTTLMRQAARLKAGWSDGGGTHAARPHEAARLASIAVAIEIELTMPLRMHNLAGLRLGHEVQPLPGGKRAAGFLIRLEPDKVKNHRLLEGTIEGTSARLLQTYLTEYRPLLSHASGPWLFPGELGPQHPRNQNSLGRAMVDAVHQHVGVVMTPHSFRSIVSSLILAADPHAIDDVRNILGHTGYATSAKHYRRSEMRGASARLAAAIQDERRSLPSKGRRKEDGGQRSFGSLLGRKAR